MAVTSFVFDEQFYLTQNPDVAAAVSRGQFSSGQDHYQQFGRFEQRDPNAIFDTSFYLGEYPDVAAAGVNPFEHFQTFGAAEGRLFNENAENVIDTDGDEFADEFDGDAYLAANPDVAEAVDAGTFANAYEHYALFGQFEDRPGVQLVGGQPIDGPFATGGTGGGANPGDTFTLTTNLDNVQGTANNDSILGSNATLSAGDVINGGGGTDTLSIAANGDFTLNPGNVTNVETLSVSASAATIATVTNVQGLQNVTNNGSTDTVTFTGVSAVGAVNISNTNQTTTVTYADAAVTGTSDAVALNLNGVAATAGNGADININSTTGNAAGVETVNITTSGLASDVDLISNDSSISRVNIAGSQNLTLSLGTGLTTSALTVNGASATGNLIIDGFGAVASTVTGGSGNDSFRFGANLGTTDTVNGGAGVDELSANAAQFAALTTTANGTFSNLEQIGIANDFAATTTVINSDLIGAVTNVRIVDQGTGDAANLTVNNLDAATSGNNLFQFDGDLGATGGSYTFNITNATTSGTANAATLDFNGGATTATSSVVLNGVETVAIDTAGATGTQTFNLTDPALTTLTATGTQSVDLSGAALGAAVSSVNASGLTGTAGISVTLSNASISSATVVGGNGADTIIGTQLGDTITVGNGSDSVQGHGGNDTINLAETTSSTDTIVFEATAAANGSDVINGFTAADALDFRLFAGDDDVTATVADNVPGTQSVADDDIFNVTDADGSITTAAQVAALFGPQGPFDGNTGGNGDYVLAIQNTANNSTTLWYIDDATTAGVTADEVALVGTLNGFSTALVDANIVN